MRLETNKLMRRETCFHSHQAGALQGCCHLHLPALAPFGAEVRILGAAVAAVYHLHLPALTPFGAEVRISGAEVADRQAAGGPGTSKGLSAS